MKILVSGGAGFVGTNLIKRLLKDGYEVTSVDNYSTGFKKNHQKGCNYLEYDIASPHSHGIYVDHDTYPTWRDEEFDIIFHMAALARIQPSLTNPHQTILNNFYSTLNLIDFARKNNTPFVYAGSSSLHHGLWGSPYAWSKFSGEQLCELYNKVYDLPTSVCRFYNVYGPHQLEEGTYATVLGIFMKQYREGKPLTITGDGEQRRDFTHIDDIVDGLVRCGRSLKIPNAYHSKVSGEIFELGRGINHSINEVASYFGDYPTKYISKRDGEYDVTLCESDLAHQKLGWVPKENIEDFVRNFVETERFLNE